MKKKLNVKKLVIFVVVIITIIYGAYKAIREYKYSGSIEGKLTLQNYTEEEIESILKNLNDTEINKLLAMKRNEKVIDFINSEYFIFDNIDEYLEYQEKNKKVEISKIIALVNVHATKDWYEINKSTDLTKKELILVNKVYSLNEDFIPENIEKIGPHYAYDGVSIKSNVLTAFEELCDSAKDSGYTLVSSLGYRSYAEQLDIYSSYKSFNGSREADLAVAHAGNSEHQSGLALEIEPYDIVVEDADSLEEHKWLVRNAYKFGFILRYPKGKEDITGFEYEPWHFRYVGIDVATKIQKKKITFDEYYAYYIERENK